MYTNENNLKEALRDLYSNCDYLEEIDEIEDYIDSLMWQFATETENRILGLD